MNGEESLRPAVEFRLLETGITKESFRFTDVSLYADWWLTTRLSLSAGTLYSMGDSVDRFLLTLGVDYRR